MNEAHVRNCVGLFFLGPFMVWYSYRKGPPELARQVMFWSGVTVLSTSGMGYLHGRFGPGLGVGDLLEKTPRTAPAGKVNGAAKLAPRPIAPPLAQPSAAPGFRSTPAIDIKGVAA